MCTISFDLKILEVERSRPMFEHEIRTEAARERAAHLSSDWSPIAPRHRVRLTLGRWLIGAVAGSRELAQPSRMKPWRAALTKASLAMPLRGRGVPPNRGVACDAP
jgi:hypothetical protein